MFAFSSAPAPITTTDVVGSALSGAVNAGTGAGRTLVVIAAHERVVDATPRVVNSLTYNGVALTHLVSHTGVPGSATTDEGIELWYLDNPAAGSNTLAATYSQNGQDAALIPLIYTHAENVIAGNVASDANVSASSISVNVTTQDNTSLLVCGIVARRAEDSPYTPHAGTTERADGVVASVQAGFSYFAGERLESAPGSYAVGATTAGGTAGDRVIVAAELYESEVGGIAFTSAPTPLSATVVGATLSGAVDAGTGANRILVVVAAHERDVNQTITGMTYNGVAMTQRVHQDEAVGGTAFYQRQDIWTLANPAAGSNTLEASYSETGQDAVLIPLIYTGDNPILVGAVASGSGATAQRSVEITTTQPNAVIVWGVEGTSAEDGPFTPDANCTERVDGIVSTANSGIAYTAGDRGPEATAGAYVVGATATGTTPEANTVVAIELYEDVGGGGGEGEGELPVLQAIGAFAEAVSGSIAPAWPAHVGGDIGLLFVESKGWGINISAPQGFKELPVSPRMGSDILSSGSTQLNAFWCRATSAAMPAPTIDHLPRQGAGSVIRGNIVTFRGCGGGEPFNALAGWDNYRTSGSVLTVPGGTTTDDNCLVVLAASAGSSGSAGKFSGWANAGLTNIVERVDSFTSTGDGSGFALATGEKLVAGAFGNTTANLAATDYMCSFMIALTGFDKSANNTPYVWSCGPVVRSAAGSVSPAWPAGHQAGDTGFLLVQSGGFPLVLGTPAGFVELGSSPQSSSGDSGGAALASLHAFWKRATTGAEASPTVNFKADNLSACILVVRGARAAGDPFDAEAGDVAFPATSSIAFPSVATLEQNSLILHFLAHGLDKTTRSIDFNGLSNTNLLYKAGYFEFPGNEGNGSGLFVAQGRKVAPGVIGNTTGTLDSSNQQAMITISLPPAQQVVEAETGSFNFTGQSAGLLHSRRIDAGAGLFNFTGQDAGRVISFNRVVESETGFINFTGQDSFLSKKQGAWSKEGETANIWTKEPPAS